jgi:hypothetical protein
VSEVSSAAASEAALIDTPKRRFWQIHLSTAVVLMFVAALILFVNLRIHREYSTVERTSNRTQLDYYDGWGWPYLYDSRGSFAFINDADGSESSCWNKHSKFTMNVHVYSQ